MIETEKKEERVLLIGVELHGEVKIIHALELNSNQQVSLLFFLRFNHLKTPQSGLKYALLHQILLSDKRSSLEIS